MRIRPTVILLAALATAAAACGKDKPHPPELNQVLPNLPLPPNAAIVSREGGEEALQFTFISGWNQDRVANYYRQTLSRGPWTLVNDTRMSDGTVALYAERNGPPLWVTIRPDSLGRGSYVTLAGARSKSDTLAPAPDSAAHPDSAARNRDSAAAR